MEKQKVKFNLEGWNVFGFEKLGRTDYPNEEAYQNAIKEREGWLLGVTTKTFTKDNGELRHCPCAVVEDSDGNIYEISADNIQCIK